MTASSKLLGISALLMFTFAGSEVVAQGKGHYKHPRHHQNHRREVHHHDQLGRPGGRTVVYQFREPRYVYYRDYNVYYDCHRDVYITLSGRNWAVSTNVPLALARHDHDRHIVRSIDVDYYDDDLPRYLERRAYSR